MSSRTEVISCFSRCNGLKISLFLWWRYPEETTSSTRQPTAAAASSAPESASSRSSKPAAGSTSSPAPTAAAAPPPSAPRELPDGSDETLRAPYAPSAPQCLPSVVLQSPEASDPQSHWTSSSDLQHFRTFSQPPSFVFSSLTVVDVDSVSVTVERWALLQRIKADRPEALTLHDWQYYDMQMFHRADALERFTGIYPVFTMLPPLTHLEFFSCENELHRSHTTPGSRWERRVFIWSFLLVSRPLPVRVLECRGLFVDRASPVVSPSWFFFRLLEIRF